MEVGTSQVITAIISVDRGMSYPLSVGPPASKLMVCACFRANDTIGLDHLHVRVRELATGNTI
jgi:hypothetical protein